MRYFVVFYLLLNSSISMATPHPPYYFCKVKCHGPDFESWTSATGRNEYYAEDNAVFNCRANGMSPGAKISCERKTNGYVDLAICNKTANPVIFVAVAAFNGFGDIPQSGDLGLIVHQWRRLKSGECTDPLDKAELNIRSDLYVYATTNPSGPDSGIQWTGDNRYSLREFCVSKSSNFDGWNSYARKWDPDLRLVIRNGCDYRYQNKIEMRRLNGIKEGQNFWNITD